MIKCLWLVLFFMVSSLFAQESVPQASAQNEVVLVHIKKLENIKPENYAQDVEALRAELDRYFDNKKRVCNGEYSTIVLGEIGGEATKSSQEGRKLSKDERKVCFREMKNLQVSYINALYAARHKYILWLQEKQLTELAKVRDEAIKRLQTNFARYLD